MTRDEIIRMAREAGMVATHFNRTSFDTEVSAYTPELKRFANLVAAAEREAMVIEAAKQGWSMKNEDPFEDAVREIAQIRARSNE